jgi:alkylation response protein AidB-like acyl-CoA dehydrogenase
MSAGHNGESVEAFRLRARDWLARNMPRLEEGAPPFNSMNVSAADAARAKELQQKLFAGGFSGLCFPVEYGGQGLTREHQQAFTEETRCYEMPFLFNTPTLTIIAPTLLEFGTEEQKRKHVSAIIRGEELWVQFMSEPSAGSDMASAITSATWDGKNYLLNGSKIWSSYAYFSDYAICLARTDWGAIKHRGLSMFIVKIHQPGITVTQIRQADGAKEFCQEFFDNVPLPADSLVGERNDGWSVAQRLLFHERSSTGGSSPFASGTSGGLRVSIDDLVELATKQNKLDDPATRQLLGEAQVLQTVQGQLIGRVVAGIEQGRLPPTGGALLRLFGSQFSIRRNSIAFEIADTEAVAWDDEKGFAGAVGSAFIFRQSRALGGGSAEIQRNIISERILGMPREAAADLGIPFKDVRRSRN